MDTTKPALLSSNGEVAKKLNNVVLQVLGQENIDGFEMSFLKASAMQELHRLLSPEYMQPIMFLQGKKLGFKTDKDKSGGYPEDVVKSCLIEAVLLGLQPHGNHFNIIAGNCYPTKEGFGYLLSNFKGLSYTVACDVPKYSADRSSATVTVKLKWTLNGKANEQVLEFMLKNDSYTTADSLIGKATRKGRCWLYNEISGREVELVDADAEEFVAEIKSNNVTTQQSKVDDSVQAAVAKATEKAEEATIVFEFDGIAESPREKADCRVIHDRLEAVGIKKEQLLKLMEENSLVEKYKDYAGFIKLVSREDLEIIVSTFGK